MTRRMTMRQFNEALRTCGHLYTARECGCLVIVMYDIPEVVHDAREDIIRESLAGRALQRCERGYLPPLNCAVHQSWSA